MAFFIIWGIGYLVFWAVLFIGYAAWFGSTSGGSAVSQSLAFLVLAFLPLLYCAASIRCCRSSVSRRQLVTLLAFSDVAILAIVVGFAAATAGANGLSLGSSLLGTASVWSPCLAASALLTIYRLCDAFPASRNVA